MVPPVSAQTPTLTPQIITTGNNVVNTADPGSADRVIGSNLSGGTRHDGSIMWFSNVSASRISNTADVFYLSQWNTTVPNKDCRRLQGEVVILWVMSASAQRPPDGSFRATAIADQASFYANPAGNNAPGVGSMPLINGISPAISAADIEASPLNRIQEQGAPGQTWQLSTSGIPGSGHTVKTIYGLNTTGEVIQWVVNGTGTGATGTTNYDANQLYKTTITDENGNSNIEYKDRDGHLVCKKVQSGASLYLSTYYIYNDLGNLSYVIPPIPSSTVYPGSFVETDDVFVNFIYGYHYDERNRLTEKKVPGKGWEFMVYNQLDQVIFSQDANQRNQTPQVWTYTKYDELGRQVITGLWSSGGADGSSGDASVASPSRILKQWLINWASGQTILWETKDNSTDNGYATMNPLGTILTINYYDDYTFPSNPFTPTVSRTMTNPTGLLTASKTAVLNTLTKTTPDMLWTVHYYDDKGRNVETFQRHYLGGVLKAGNYDDITTSYNFTNADSVINRNHYVDGTASPAVIVTNAYTYDHMGRRLKTFEQIGSGSNVLLSQIDYNELGQVMSKHLHGATGSAPFLQDINYAYNERGWLTKINDPSASLSTTQLFSEQLNYNLPQYGALAQFNGNIAEQDYNAGVSGRQHFVYSYDALNRLTAGMSTAGFSETGISYDNLGNLLTLTRSGTGNGALNYSNYIGSRLQSISGFKSGSYVYDNNGNVTTDGTRGATVNYNMLDLPQTVTATGVNIIYVYDATGRKLRKVANGASTDYISGIQYKADGTIDFIQTEEGRANRSGTNYVYEYTLTDHLGNNRVTFDQTNGKVGEDDYYPFGLNVHRQANAGNKYLYNKKELQEELNQYDYGARFYDPVIARWTSMDPLAEISRRWSPYNYAENNPTGKVDPDGMAVGDVLYGLEAQGAFKALQAQQAALIALSQIPGGGPGHGNKGQHRPTTKRDGPSLQPNAYQIALHAGVILTAAKANEGFGLPPYKPGTYVREFKAVNAKGFSRVFTNGKTSPEGQWIMRTKDLEGLSPAEIQEKWALPNQPDGISDVEIPNGTQMRSGVAGSNFGSEGGGIQYQLMERVKFVNTRLLKLFQTIFSTTGSISTNPGGSVEPSMPVEPIEPIDPIIP